MDDVRAKCIAKGLTWIGAKGPLNAKIAIVGEAPGAEEEKQGRPFCGGAGFLLDSILNQVGLAREQVYVTNVVKVRPPENEIKRLPELGLTVHEFIPQLENELSQVRPNLVVALGATALEALTNEQGIMKWRGSILESSLIPNLKVIPSVHPAAILIQYKWRPLLWLDMKKVVKESSSAKINLPERNLMIEPSFNEVKDILRNIKSNYQKVAYDIEVDRNGKMTCISLSPSPKWAISIPFRKAYSSYWMEGEEVVIWKWLEEYVFQADKQLIVQNGLFDNMWLVPRVGYFPVYMDTMWAHQTCYAEIAKGLDMLCSIYTNEPYYKDERKVWKDTSITRQLWNYNAKDAVVTLEVALRLEEELQALKLSDFFFGFVMKLQPVLLEMQMRGMHVDRQKRKDIRGELEARKKELEGAFGSLNLRSTKQVSEFLYTKLGLPKQYHRKTGQLTTNKEALIKLRRKLR